MIKGIFFNNYLLMLAVLAWFSAQVIKTILYFAIHKKFNGERLVGAGGMPSSHSALVCSVFVGVAKLEGVSSPLFAFAFVLASIVMYDAMGVRQEAGKQAKVINLILEDLKEDGQGISSPTKLKEMVGHTPFQVVSGALLGILIAVMIPAF